MKSVGKSILDRKYILSFKKQILPRCHAMLTAISQDLLQNYNTVDFALTHLTLQLCFFSGAGLSDPVVEQVRAAGTGWFAGLMCVIALLLLVLAGTTTVRWRLGAIYPGE